MRRSALISLALLAAGCGGGGSGGGGASAAAAVTSGSPSPTSTASAPPPPPARTAPANLQTGPMVALDPDAQAAFFDLPWPCDARLTAAGAPDLTGLPNPRSKDFIRAIYDLAQSDVRGFSPSGVVYLRFDAPILAPVDDPLVSVDPGSPVLLVDVDPASPEYLARRPFHTSVTTTPSGFRPENLLQLLPVPGVALRPRTTYAAIVLRRLGAPGAPFLGQPAALTDLLAGSAPAGARGARLQQAYLPLRRALDGLRLHPDDIAAATVFTTGDPTESLQRQVTHVASLPPLRPTRPLVTRDVFPDFTALQGFYAPPAYQQGVPPYAFGGGRQVVDAQGLPVVQRLDTAEFQLSVPKGRMPASGFPLYFYVHGTGGDAAQAIDRGRRAVADVPSPPGSGIASIVAPHGWATACAAGHMSPPRIGVLSADGYAAYNVLNAVAMRDNFVQMVLEQVHFRSLLLDLRIDPALCPGTDASAASDGKVRFDPRLVVVSGQSLGSYLTGMLTSTLDGWAGAVLTGAGGSWVEFAFGPKDPVDLQLVLEVLALPPGEKLDRFHPLVMGFDLAVGPADNTHYVRKIFRQTPAGRTPPHVLIVEGHVDLQVPTNLQRALVLAMGADMAGPDVGARADDRLEPCLPWGGLRQLPYPLGGNVTLPSGAVRTCVVVRYPEDGIREGHYVITQRDEPKRQVAEFLDALAGGQTPVIRQ